MNTTLKFALALAAIAGLSMLRPVQLKFNELVNMGTVAGVAKCAELNANSVISEEATKRGCAEVFQRRIYQQGAVTGRASANIEAGQVVFSGNLENQTTDEVITWVEFAYKTFDTDGVAKEFQISSPFWIEPRASIEFELPIQEMDSESFERQQGCEGEPGSERDCWAWGWSDLQGVALN